MTKIGRHYFISGRVQGVFYRDSACKKADEIGVTGWVKNTSDGRVECTAFGTAEQLELFEQWLWQGPQTAKVTGIEITDTSSEAPYRFSRI